MISIEEQNIVLCLTYNDANPSHWTEISGDLTTTTKNKSMRDMTTKRNVGEQLNFYIKNI